VHSVQENESPEAHASCVWRDLVLRNTKAKHVAVVAHSYGGFVVTHLVCAAIDSVALLLLYKCIYV